MGTTDKSPLKKGVHLRGVYAYEGYMYLLTGVSVKRSVSLRGVSVKRGSTVLSNSPKLPEVFGTGYVSLLFSKCCVWHHNKPCSHGLMQTQ